MDLQFTGYRLNKTVLETLPLQIFLHVCVSVNPSSLGLNIVGSGGGRCWFAAMHV